MRLTFHLTSYMTLSIGTKAPDLALSCKTSDGKRSAFIIDQNGVIQYAESSDDPKQLPNFAAIKAILQKLA